MFILITLNLLIYFISISTVVNFILIFHEWHFG